MLNINNQNMTISNALFSPGPHPDFEDKLYLFGQFIGSWDVDVSSHLPDGEKRIVKGEWHFGWALEGRAILDVWITPRRELRAEMPGIGDYGATLRFYDPEIDAWHSTWIGPAKHFVFPFIGRLTDGEIVLEGNFEEGTSSRWIFSDIKADSFRWRAVQSTNNWATHQLLQEMIARRVNVISKT